VKVVLAELQIPEKKSNGVKPEPLGGTRTIATLFRFVTLRVFNDSEIAVTVPESPLTVADEPTDAPKVPLTVIPLDEVHVVTLPVVVHAARDCGGSSSALMARTNELSLSSAERCRIAKRAWDAMEQPLVVKPLAIFRKCQWRLIGQRLSARHSRDAIGPVAFAIGENIMNIAPHFPLEHANLIKEPKAPDPGTLHLSRRRLQMSTTFRFQLITCVSSGLSRRL
jgi:hypothetical protein